MRDALDLAAGSSEFAAAVVGAVRDEAPRVIDRVDAARILVEAVGCSSRRREAAL